MLAQQMAAAAASSEEALRWYGKRLEESRACAVKGRPSFATLKKTDAQAVPPPRSAESRADVLGELATDMSQQQAPEGAPGKVIVVDGESVLACQVCQLPLGERAYVLSGGGDGQLSHAECAAQHSLREVRADEQLRKEQAAALKRSRREEFDIGWRPETIPSAAVAAAKLGCAVVPRGLCCLVSEDGGVRVAPTLEPAAAVNLEYLSLALQVRRTEGCEPLFSLDPVDNGRAEAERPEASMQEKRFEPEWLAGTSVGEVMFQADYHLKELSFGEYEQPITGMRSCFDYEESDDREWSAREWFVVRKAEMHISEDRVLVPSLRMGVEAREQVMGDDGLEDAALTHADHPLVKYADEFTHNFDLIAERRSVIYQLREVAKASIMAKYLLESGVGLSESWFSLAEEGKAVCCYEVPQLWNDRFYLQVTVQDGILRSRDTLHGLYGGIDFGIDRFRLSAPSRVATSVVAGRAVLGRPATSLMASAPRAGLTVGPARQFARLSAPMSASMSLTAARAGLGAPRVAAGLTMGAPQGVDLSLERFNLSAPLEGGRWGGAMQAADEELAIGSAFWAALERGTALQAEDRSLLMDIFHPLLSDRRADGEHFAPPPTHSPYMTKLRQLVKAEHVMRTTRKEHFLSAAFYMDAAGPLFPLSWTSSVTLAREAREVLQARPEYLAERGLLAEFVKSLAPSFDRCTEDGTRFRVYRLGRLEVRSVQDLQAEESIGAVFSVGAGVSGGAVAQGGPVEEGDRVVKATEYVERDTAQRCHAYVVLETRGGHSIVTERPSEGGPAIWTENPAGLERRSGLGKVIRSSEEVPGVTVAAVKRAMVVGQVASPTRYAQYIYAAAAGRSAAQSASGFRRAGVEKYQAFPRFESLAWTPSARVGC